MAPRGRRRGAGRAGLPLSILALIIALVVHRLVRDRWGLTGSVVVLMALAVGAVATSWWPRRRPGRRR